MSSPQSDPPKAPKPKVLRRLGRTAVFSLVRGAGTAAGAAAITALTWWAHRQ